MGHSEHDAAAKDRRPWNVGRMVGAKRALKPQQLWAIRFWLDRERRLRDRAMFDTKDQVDALKTMCAGARDPRTGDAIYYGWPKGSENSGRFVKDLPGWSLYWADPAHRERPARASFWRIWSFQDPSWDWWTFDFDAGMKSVDDRLAATINAMNPDLSAFQTAGGKLIHLVGNHDPPSLGIPLGFNQFAFRFRMDNLLRAHI